MASLLLIATKANAWIAQRVPVATNEGVTNSYAMTLPSGLQNGDIIHLHVYTTSGTGITTPSGYTQVWKQTDGAFICAEYIKTASSEGATVTVTLTGTPFVFGWVGALYDTSGATVALDTSNAIASNSATTVTLPTISPSGSDPYNLIVGEAIDTRTGTSVAWDNLLGFPQQDTSPSWTSAQITANAMAWPSKTGSGTAQPVFSNGGFSVNWIGAETSFKVTSASGDRIVPMGATYTENDVSSSTSIVATVPFLTAQNDTMVALVGADGGSITQGSWTQQNTQDSGTWDVFTRNVVGAAEPSSYTFSYAPSTHQRVEIVTFRDMDGITSQYDISTLNGPSSATSLATGTLTTAFNHETVLAGWITSNVLTSIAMPTGTIDSYIGYGPITGQVITAGNTYEGGLSAFPQETAGTTSARTMSNSTSVVWHGAQVAIAPSTPTPTPTFTPNGGTPTATATPTPVPTPAHPTATQTPNTSGTPVKFPC